MKQFLILGAILLVFSCKDVETKKVNSEDILAEELKTFNWKDVDEYPSFASCDSTLGKDNKKICFETTLREFLNESLSRHRLIVAETIDDTIELKIHIGKDGGFTIKQIDSNSETKEQLPELDSILRASFDSLPKIFPAIKRSQQVATEFKLPVIIRIE